MRSIHNPMMIYPAVHYTMGGIWVDYNLQTTIPDVSIEKLISLITELSLGALFNARFS
jgi:succinate dehydrogenase/fumarate reductase flavoprotein subunit